ncbi:MAG: cytidine deaminase [Candidatus Rifleibacteriota bacterium]
MTSLKKYHFYLIESAKKLISQRFRQGRHHFAAALKTKSGKIYLGLHLKSRVEKNEICAEAVAIANAAAANDCSIEAIVLVDRNGKVITPCGSCRELILDYSSTAEVVVTGSAGAKVLKIGNLLPLSEHD